VVEPARKHGSFDTRYPARPKREATTWELRPDRDGSATLGWSAFLTRFFPNGRRHDLDALAAYESYRNALERASAAADPLTRGAVEARERSAGLPLPVELVWEWEGGAAAERPVN